MGVPQYADLSNQQVMDHLQQQNPDNQMQHYQQDEEQQDEEEEGEFFITYLLILLQLRGNGSGHSPKSRVFHQALEVDTQRPSLVLPWSSSVAISTRAKKLDSLI